MAVPLSTPLPDHLRSCRIVLCRTQGPVNVGMVARLCGNFGITDLRLVDPLCEVDSPDARRFSTWSKDLMLAAPVSATIAEAVADCGLVVGTTARVRDATLGAPMLPEALPALLAQRPSAKWALVFGNEADGLNEEELRHCQAFVRLRTYGANYSFNLSHAVAITLYVLAQQEAPVPAADAPEAATRASVDHLTAYWLHTLERFDYFRRTDKGRFAPQLERLINRLHLSQHDVQMLWGMLAQFHLARFGDRAAPGSEPPSSPRGPAANP